MERLVSKRGVPYLLLALATLMVWAHTVTFSFVWDDDFFIRRLSAVRSLKNIPEMFFSIEAQATEPYLFRVFRPIRTAHYAVLHALAGGETPKPWIFHLANVVWHGAVAMMLFTVLELLLSKLRSDWSLDEARVWALLVALGFAVHPVVSEVVCWAKSLDDILAAFFTLASLRELLKPADRRSTRWLALLFFILAVYSKESAVPFAIMPCLIYRAIHRLSWKECAQRTFLFFFIGVVYMAHRGYIIERTSQTEPLSGTYIQTLVDMLPVVGKYSRLLLGIPPFLSDYQFMKGGFSFWSMEVWGGILLLALFGMGAFIAWRKSQFRIFGFGLLWSGLFLLPVSNFVPMMQYMAERFLYLPLIGWLISLLLLFALISNKSLGRLLVIILIFLWGVTAWNRSWVWKDELTLFITTFIDCPSAKRVEHNSVSAILHLPQVASVFQFDDNNDKLSYTMPTDKVVRQQLVDTFRQAFLLLPRSHIIISCYGITLASTGHPETAVTLFKKAVKLKPKYADYWLNLARAALDSGKYELARDAAAKANEISPNHPVVLRFMAELEWKMGDLPAARAAVLRWREVAPNPENADWLFRLDEFLNSQPAAMTNR